MARKATKRPPSADRILDAALALAAAMPWRDVSMEKIAAEAGASLQQVHSAFPSRAALLSGFVRRIDDAVLAGHDPQDSGEPVRERLLDVLLRRFDALRPHKAAVKSILRGAGCDPAATLCAVPALMSSMAWSLEAAGLGTAGLLGLLRTKGLAAIYLSAMRVWLRDESEDLSPTAAHLDRNLRRAEAMMLRLPVRGRRPAA